MEFSNAIQVPPEFFAKAKNDYGDWTWALAREFMQNSIDCGSSRIDVELAQEGGNTRLTVTNNGDPMSEHILCNKLLALGASGKDFVGQNVGGFGKAKEILYFCHLDYEIQTGSLQVRGQGAGYDLADAPFLHGTRSSVLIEGTHTSTLEDQFQKFALECQWGGELCLNGEQLRTNLKKGSRRRDLGWAVIYTNKSFRHRLVVRIDGMPMFSRYVNLDRCVIVEVKRSSGKALTSNRDGLVSDYRHKLEAWVDELTVDRSRALRDVPITTYHHFEGDRQYGGANSEPIRDLVAAAYATPPQPAPVNQAENTPTLAVDQEVNYDEGPSFVDSATHLERPAFAQRGHCTFEFIVKNNTGLQVPDHFLPFGFSVYSKKLVSVWVKCLLELHRMFNFEATFAVGFILDDEREAEHEKTDKYGQVYYINPAVVVSQISSNSRSLKKRWKFNNAGNYAVLAAAVHEFVHGQGHSPHDEGYAGRLTDKLAVVMASKKVFHPCFR